MIQRSFSTIHDLNKTPSTVKTPSFAAALVLLLLTLSIPGCLSQGPTAADTYVWGRKGLDDGRFFKPRAITVDRQDRLYVADKTGRIQVFDRDGGFIRSWRIPEVYQGKPVGLSISHDDLLIVCDTHYFRLLFYTPDGELVESRTIGGKNGRGPGEFGFITDVAQDSKHNYYVGDYGDFDRIQKFAPDGNYICEIGKHGQATGEFLRPQSLQIDSQDRLWVADACNHRIQVFDAKFEPPKFLFQWGKSGSAPSELNYPYAIEFLPDGNLLICEFGNHRVQKFTPDGKSLGTWGSPGKGPGQLSSPWAIGVDSQGMTHILDTYNHRIQRFKFYAQ